MMNNIPALSVIYFFHLAATVVWIGGQVAFLGMVLPALRKISNEKVVLPVLEFITGRLQTIGWFCLGVLVLTGMFQMSSNRNYEGFLSITNTWAVAILIKHLVIGLIIAVNLYLTWFIKPALHRLNLRASQQDDSPTALVKLRKQEMVFFQVNFWLSLIVLALTALARSAS